MSAADVVKAWYAAFEAGDVEALAAHTADNFEMSGPMPEPVGKEAYLGMASVMSTAFPDWSFNLSNVQEQGNNVTVTHQITATHQNDLDLSAMGMPVIPATGKAVKLAAEKPEITVENDKVTSFKVKPSPEAGLPALLKQLGVEMPSG